MTDRTCPPDEALYPLLADDPVAPIVRGHLGGCAACRRRLDRLRAELDELRSVVSPSDAPRVPQRPATIGRYLVVGDLGSGGQSEVFRALHPTLEHEVVIKLSRNAIGRLSADRHLLVAEGKLLASLDHPNLARVFDLDFHDDRPFLALEYVRGRTLQRYAAEEQVTPRLAARLVAGVARALAVAHRKGIVHQDVKPANVLVDGDGGPRLIDFGLARLRHAWADGPADPSGGTPAYMAPEQARDETDRIGPRSDVFALGGLLYFLLTGAAPFAAESKIAALNRAGCCDFDRAALGRAPRSLAAICLKAMAERPEDRYPSADALADALERYAGAPARRRRLVLAAAAMLLLAVGGWTLPQMWKPVPVVAAPQFVLTARVSRGDQSLDLTAALPLTEADLFEFVATVPAESKSAMFHVNTLGQVERLAAQASPADGMTRLIYPGRGQMVPLDPGTRGTEAVLVLAADTADQLAGLEPIVASELADLPRLPAKTVVCLTRDEPKPQGIPFGSPEDDPVAVVSYKLDRLRQRLLHERKLSVILGVAFGH